MTVERIQEYIKNRMALLTEWEDERAWQELDALDKFIRKTDYRDPARMPYGPDGYP